MVTKQGIENTSKSYDWIGKSAQRTIVSLLVGGLILATATHLFQNRYGHKNPKQLANELVDRYYTVQEGDTLSEIAEEYGLNHGPSLEVLKKYNPEIKDIDKIYPGQVLYLGKDYRGRK